jgi:NAD(P)-dependent dehydrogenase (short-subunit alcohol dehydrogenase family)
VQRDPEVVPARVIVVTGASRGLGEGMTRAFAAGGARVGTCARSRPEVGDVREAVDVTDRAAVRAFLDHVVGELGPIDLWVSNAGLLEPIAPVRAVDPGAFGHVVDVNLLGALHCAQAYLDHRAPLGSGCLVTISSGAARRGYAGWGAYCASKAGVDRLMECIAREEPWLRAHAVAPGIVDTDMQAAIRATPADVFPDVERFRRFKAEGRFSSPAHVAGHLLELAFGERSDEVVLRLPDER